MIILYSIWRILIIVQTNRHFNIWCLSFIFPQNYTKVFLPSAIVCMLCEKLEHSISIYIFLVRDKLGVNSDTHFQDNNRNKYNISTTVILTIDVIIIPEIQVFVGWVRLCKFFGDMNNKYSDWCIILPPC